MRVEPELRAEVLFGTFEPGSASARTFAKK
jgi:hypothetical protein